MRLRGSEALGLFFVGALGGLIGDACHVVSGTTAYLDETLPFVWKSQLWFPFAVGLATAATGEVYLRLGGGPVRVERPEANALAAVAAVIAIYALTAVVTDEATLTATVLTWALALGVWGVLGGGTPAVTCAILAAVLGPLAEIAVVSADLSAYAPEADGLGGVAEWLPALYFAFGIVVARLTGLLAAAADERA